MFYFVTEVKLFILIVFGVEHIPEEIGNKIIKAKIFRVQVNNPVMRDTFALN